MTDETPQETTMSGEGNQPEGTGYAPPDTGLGDNAESEIPVGVDEIEAKAPPEGEEDGGNAPVDLANLDTGDADAEAEVDAEAEAVDADAEGEAAEPAPG
jgi:hypothetical protein